MPGNVNQQPWRPCLGSISGGTLRRWHKTNGKSIWEEKLETFKVSTLAACPFSKVFAVVRS
jgi:hypothetical protein